MSCVSQERRWRKPCGLSLRSVCLDGVFQQLAVNGYQGYRSIIWRFVSISLLVLEHVEYRYSSSMMESVQCVVRYGIVLSG